MNDNLFDPYFGWTDETCAEYDRWFEETPIAASIVADNLACEHGLSKSLCAGPMHYPMDEPPF